MLQIPSNYENLKITFGQLNIKTYCAVYQPNCIKVKIVLVSNCKRSLASDDKLSKIISLLHFNLTDLYETIQSQEGIVLVTEDFGETSLMEYILDKPLQQRVEGSAKIISQLLNANMEKKKVQIEKLVNDLVNQINSQETTLYKKLFSNLWTKEVEEEYNEKKIIKKEKYQKIIQLIKEIISNNNNNQSKSKKENDNKNEKENENEKGYDCIKNNTKKRKEKTKEGIDNGSSETNSTANKNSSNEIPFERELVLLSDTSDNKLFFSFGKEQKQNNSDPKEKPKLKIIKKPEKRAFQREETGENKENWGEVGGEEKIAEKKKDQEKKKKKKTMKMKMKMKEDNKTTNQNKKTNDGDFGKKFDQIEESNKMEELELRKILGEIKLFKNDLNVSDQSNSTERMIRKIEREKIKTTRRHQRSYSKRKEDEKKNQIN